jgi:hypothetical protein
MTLHIVICGYCGIILLWHILYIILKSDWLRINVISVGGRIQLLIYVMQFTL